jgi:hypothetical protein
MHGSEPNPCSTISQSQAHLHCGIAEAGEEELCFGADREQKVSFGAGSSENKFHIQPKGFFQFCPYGVLDPI